MTKTEKLTIAQNICAPLLKKIKDDLQRNAYSDDDSVHRLDYRYTTGTVYILDVLWCQPIKLIQVVSTSEFHEY